MAPPVRVLVNTGTKTLPLYTMTGVAKNLFVGGVQTVQDYVFGNNILVDNPWKYADALATAEYTQLTGLGTQAGSGVLLGTGAVLDTVFTINNGTTTINLADFPLAVGNGSIAGSGSNFTNASSAGATGKAGASITKLAGSVTYCPAIIKAGNVGQFFTLDNSGAFATSAVSLSAGGSLPTLEITVHVAADNYLASGVASLTAGPWDGSSSEISVQLQLDDGTNVATLIGRRGSSTSGFLLWQRTQSRLILIDPLMTVYTQYNFVGQDAAAIAFIAGSTDAFPYSDCSQNWYLAPNASTLFTTLAPTGGIFVNKQSNRSAPPSGYTPNPPLAGQAPGFNLRPTRLGNYNGMEDCCPSLLRGY